MVSLGCQENDSRAAHHSPFVLPHLSSLVCEIFRFWSLQLSNYSYIPEYQMCIYLLKYKVRSYSYVRKIFRLFPTASGELQLEAKSSPNLEILFTKSVEKENSFMFE